MHEIDALPLDFNHTTVYAHTAIARNDTKNDSIQMKLP